jgi:hypothetical protein
MYCPSVLNMPFGPGPKRTIFVAPKMKPIMRPTAICNVGNGQPKKHLWKQSEEEEKKKKKKARPGKGLEERI